MFEGLTMKQKIITITIIAIVSIGIIYYVYNKSNNYKVIEEGDILISESSDQSEDNNLKAEGQNVTLNEEIIVHIAGEVNNPGIVKLKEGNRIEDAITAAGGLTAEADISHVNLAYVLEDGIKINIPNKNNSKEEYIIEGADEGIVSENISDNESSSKEEKNMININKATQTELETLQGIGPSLAGRIISYREENGKFKTIEEIKNVSGIGDTKFENIKNNICIK